VKPETSKPVLETAIRVGCGVSTGVRRRAARAGRPGRREWRWTAGFDRSIRRSGPSRPVGVGWPERGAPGVVEREGLPRRTWVYDWQGTFHKL